MFKESIHPARATLLLIPGFGGGYDRFLPLAGVLDSDVAVTYFKYDARQRLGCTAHELRVELLKLRGHTTVVAHCMGASLMMYLGATDPDRQLSGVSAVYVNPLIGGSRWADVVQLLPLSMKHAYQRLFLAPSIRDLNPESAFQQAIFGPAARPSSFRDATIMLFSERHGEDPGVLRKRTARLFGASREQLLARIGRTLNLPPIGHSAPFDFPEMLLPTIRETYDGTACNLGDALQGGRQNPGTPSQDCFVVF